jgi:uncharacterized protein (DUF58 family)
MGVPLNADVSASISQLRDALKDFELRLKLYRILFRGKGLDFDGYRTYSPEDDASLIDWKASMRANKTMVKQYREEQDIQIMFVVDVGEHMLTGSSPKLKAEYMVEALAALMHLVLKEGDRIGLITFNNRVTNVIVPKKGNKHFDYMLDVLLDSSTYGGGSDFLTVSEFLIDYVGRSVKAVIFVSDFLAMKESAVKQMQIIGDKFETLAIMVKDPLDRQLPDVGGEVVFEDPTTGEQLLVDPKIARRMYAAYTKKQDELARSIFTRAGIDILSLSTDVGFVPGLAEFIKERVKQRKLI